ncbi:MAG TPA: ABC transporter ATP-binding protein, partial [Candidatus Avipropionibacterium avicola]|nr:ABC transporter ATP-binding protein [Candidatus Avipropionibacterium avicola]
MRTVDAPADHGLELVGITKRFGPLVANDAISVSVATGEIHCLLGENGAGKSTLMNVLYGMMQPDSGEIVVDGQPVRIASPRDAIAAGIGMVHQHFMLVPVFTVAENIALSHAGARPLSRQAARRKVRELSARFGLQVDPDAVVEDLPVGVQQRVEILKALANEARFLILDEPTAVLTPQEIDELMRVMRELRDEGRGIVFITHKLREVRAIADRITVIRRGRVVGQAEASDSEARLAELMVGRNVSLTVTKEPARTGPARLEISHLSVANPAGQVVVDDVDLTVAGGEVLGIAGVQGNGQTELAETLLGLTRAIAGEIRLDGRLLNRLSPRRTIGAGVGFVPEDRKTDGFVGTFSIADNLVLNQTRSPSYSRASVLDRQAIATNAIDRVAEFDIRCTSIESPVSSLSGGNQQKVVLARELSRPLSLLVANQPTRGVDVGAIEFLHNRIVDERDTGTAVLLISTELDEVIALSDRIAVMFRGKIVGIVEPEVGREVLGLMMAGVPADEARSQVSDQDEEDLR